MFSSLILLSEFEKKRKKENPMCPCKCESLLTPPPENYLFFPNLSSQCRGCCSESKNKKSKKLLLRDLYTSHQ